LVVPVVSDRLVVGVVEVGVLVVGLVAFSVSVSVAPWLSRPLGLVVSAPSVDFGGAVVSEGEVVEIESFEVALELGVEVGALLVVTAEDVFVEWVGVDAVLDVWIGAVSERIDVDVDAEVVAEVFDVAEWVSVGVEVWVVVRLGVFGVEVTLRVDVWIDPPPFFVVFLLEPNKLRI
jgi:hypothetical protein